jgi:hypothetical protein
MTDINETGAASAVVDDTFLEEGMTRFAWLEETAGVAGLPGEEDRQSQATASIVADLESQISESAAVDQEGIQPGQLDLILQAAEEARVAGPETADAPPAEAEPEGPPDTASESISGLARLFSMDTLKAATLYNDLAQRETQAFLQEIRTNGQLAGIRAELDELKVILARPDTPAGVRTYLAPALKGFERELQNLEQGTPALLRTAWFAANLLPAAYTTAVAIKEQDRLLGVTFAASGLRGVTTLVGKTVSTLGNTGVMTDHFIDWVLPWFIPCLSG